MATPPRRFLLDENEEKVRIDKVEYQTAFIASIDREEKLKAQLRLAEKVNARLAAKNRWHKRHLDKRTGSDPKMKLMLTAQGIAREALRWKRGQPAPRRLQEFVLVSMRTAWPDLEPPSIKFKVDALLFKLTPGSRGPRGEIGLTKAAYNALSGNPADTKNRSMRGPMERLYSKTVTQKKL